MTNQAKIISVFGSSTPKPNSADYEAARMLGQQLAKAGFAVQTGGYSGVMSAASQGAHEVEGHVIGVTCRQIEQFRQMPANPWVREEIKHNTLRERLLYLIDHCDGAIIMPGGIGTLSELSLLWSLVQVDEISARPIVTVGGLWQRTMAAFMEEAYIKPKHQDLVKIVRTVPEAVTEIQNHFIG